MGILKNRAILLLALSLMIAPELLLGESHHFEKQNLVPRDYAVAARKAGQAAWHTAQLGMAGLGSFFVWELCNEGEWKPACIYSVALCAVGARGLNGLKELYKNNENKGEQSWAKKVALGAWYAAQLASLAYIVRDYDAISDGCLRDRVMMGLTSLFIISNSCLGFKDLLSKQDTQIATESDSSSAVSRRKITVRKLRLLNKIREHLAEKQACEESGN